MCTRGTPSHQYLRCSCFKFPTESSLKKNANDILLIFFLRLAKWCSSPITRLVRVKDLTICQKWVCHSQTRWQIYFLTHSFLRTWFSDLLTFPITVRNWIQLFFSQENLFSHSLIPKDLVQRPADLSYYIHDFI